MTSDIQSHLHNALLTGQASDITIRISGAFNAIYRLHRVVLIQAGFWQDLFIGGFAEQKQTALDVVLDDRNITRAAFEFAISRLYGSQLPLYFHPSMVPTASYPLTIGFPFHSVQPLSTPSQHQPASPQFLLSLLSTSIYLSIPSLASEALTGILRTIGPRSIVLYLDFALGRTELGDADRPAVGLDGLAKSVEESSEGENSIRSQRRPDRLYSLSSSSSLACSEESLGTYASDRNSVQSQFYYGPISDKIGEACVCWLAKWSGSLIEEEEKAVLEWVNDPSATLLSFEGNSSETLSLAGLSQNAAPSIGSDSLKPRSKTKSIPKLFSGSAVSEHHGGLSLDWIHALISSDDFFVPSLGLYTSAPTTSSSSPSSFGNSSYTVSSVEGPEEERYAFAKRVMELRRAVRAKVVQLAPKQIPQPDEEGWETLGDRAREKGKQRAEFTLAPDQENGDGSFEQERPTRWEKDCIEENEQWDLFFQTKIFYVNMHPEAVLRISQDISPSRGRPYVDLRTLQEASWDQLVLKHALTSDASTAGDKLGFAKTVSELLPTLTTSTSALKRYFLVPSDESLRVGDTITGGSGRANAEGNIHNNITMDELFENSLGKNYLYRTQDKDVLPRRSGTLGRVSALSPSNDNRHQLDNKPSKEPVVPRAKTSNVHTYFGLIGGTCYPQIGDSGAPYLASPLFPQPSSPFLSLPLSPSQLLSSHPPLRFSVEFFNLEAIKEKERLHSRTVWYAGSFWNVYVSIVKKKDKSGSIGNNPELEQRWTGAPGTGIMPNYQLGVYLQRQSPTENAPPFSAPDPFSATRWLSHSGLNDIKSTSSTVDSKPHTHNSRRPSSSPSSDTPTVSTFSPLTPVASAPQVAASSVTALRTPTIASLGSRSRGNSTSSPVPSRTPGSPPSPQPRTPGGSGGWRNNSSNMTSSSLPTMFSSFGRSRHQSHGSRDRNRINLEYGIPGASASTPFVGSSSSPPSATPLPSPPADPSPSNSELTLPDLPFHAIRSSKVPAPYIDRRSIVSVYFAVNCASLTGNAQTRFRSAPDVFKVGQSWGWKSSGLIDGPKGRLNRNVSNADNDYEAAIIQMDGETTPPVGHQVSLRATVVLGIV